MAACFGAEFDSDAFFFDISSPPISQAQSNKALAPQIQGFRTIFGKKLQGLQNQVFKKPQLQILPDSDFEDDLLGYTPPPRPAKRKGTFRQPIEIIPEKLWRALYEFIKSSKVNWKNSLQAKHLLKSDSSFFF
jgi:hypothetical protein